MAACIYVEWCRYPVVGTNDVTFVFKRVELHVIAWSVCHQHKDTYMHIVFILVRICRRACKRVGTVLLNPSSCHQHKSIPRAAPTFSITDSNLLFDSVVAWAWELSGGCLADLLAAGCSPSSSVRKNPTKSADEIRYWKAFEPDGSSWWQWCEAKVCACTKHEGRRESVLFGRHGGISARYRGWLHLWFLASIAHPTMSVWIGAEMEEWTGNSVLSCCLVQCHSNILHTNTPLSPNQNPIIPHPTILLSPTQKPYYPPLKTLLSPPNDSIVPHPTTLFSVHWKESLP